MEEKNYSGTIPAQEDGSKINIESAAETKDTQKAKALFNIAKERLLDVNHWQELTGKMLADFQLTDQKGQHVEGPAQEGLLFKIDIPGPGSKAGEGFDWARVEKIESYSSEDIDSIGIRVRPVANPTTADDSVAHFYSEESTSTFTVSREGTKVTAAVYDRNTKTNQNTNKITDQIRNAAVGAAGILTFSRIQWKSLTEALIKKAD
jgi:hypothetical protein